MAIISGEILIPVSRLHRNPDNPRREAGDIGDLKRAIEEEGVLQPLLVRPSPVHGDGHYVIEIGERRWTACRFIDPEYEVPCRVYMPSPGENLTLRAVRIGLIENLHREGLSAMEKARAYGRMRDEGSMTQAEIAKAVGLNASTISQYLALLVLAPKMQAAVESGKLPVHRALEVVKEHRAKERQQKGYKPADVGWEPDHFTENHFLARHAKAMCDERDHSNRRRRGGACDQCWETVIRADEAKVQSMAMREMGLNVPFIPPVTAAAGNVIGRGKGEQR